MVVSGVYDPAQTREAVCMVYVAVVVFLAFLIFNGMRSDRR